MRSGPFLVGLAAVAPVWVLGWFSRPHRRLGGRRPARGPMGASPVPGRWLRRWRRVGIRAGWSTGEPADLLHLRSSLAGGASLLQAFERLTRANGPWAGGAAHLVRQVRLGVALQDALDSWADESVDPVLVLVADALAIAQRTGGSQERALDAVVAAARDREALRREVRALASQARASAAVMVLMPMAFALIVAVLDPRIAQFYVGTALGPLAVGIGLALDAVGAWWMSRLVRRVS